MMKQTILRWSPFAAFFALIFILAGSSAADPNPVPGEPSSAVDVPDMTDEDKRAWQNLQSAWGKRAWQNFQGGWGKRGWQDMNSAWGKRAWSALHGGWGKRAWQSFHGAWGKRDPADLLEFLESEYPQRDADVYESNTLDQYAPVRQVLSNNADHIIEVTDGLEQPEKRAWTALHGSWGKRPNQQQWSRFKGNQDGSWGKREPGWNNLKGLWGKRSSSEHFQPIYDTQGDYSDKKEE